VDTPETRPDAIALLAADLADLESGGEPANYAAGHGLMSRVWRFAWDEPSLRLDFTLPLARVLADDEDQAADLAEIAAAIRMALLLLAAAGSGTLLAAGETRLTATYDGTTPRWSVEDADANLLDESDDWTTLAARLEATLPDTPELVIWP
jgi:hypothetical protein